MTVAADAPRIELQRVMTPDHATSLAGDWVDDLPPTHTEAFIGTEDGRPIMAYLPLPNAGSLRRAVLPLQYGAPARAAGMTNLSKNFGYQPRRPAYMREGCRASGLTAEAPESELTLAHWAGELQAILQEIDPAVVTHDKAELTAVQPDWRLGESDLWTSGVINKTAILPYHRDSFNFPTWSAMPVFRRGMNGGYLSIPEYDVVLPCRDSWVAFFPGHQLLHGVTPLYPKTPDGYRISIVYYALRGMKDCYTAAMESAYARERRTERERDMAARLKGGEDLDASRQNAIRNSGRVMGGRPLLKELRKKRRGE
jgi:hypothetical protein